ncbi:hypothetical protein HDU80_009862 [Chytriomyces hyalinus]|nr:hypothetical protein HDU80_009862 [Chytriomyces hyalinus]
METQQGKPHMPTGADPTASESTAAAANSALETLRDSKAPIDSNAASSPNSTSISTSSLDETLTRQISPRICSACNLAVSGQSVRALGLFYHIDCFRCNECKIPVALKFFPFYPNPEDKIHPVLYCEKHYFALHGLICHKCGHALRGPHINALGKKFHLEHFGCAVCPKIFRQHDSYYERDDQVYCQFHYSVRFAAKCGGCQTAVLKKFVEMRKEGVLYQWHPQCYMIYKLWNVKANFQHELLTVDEKDPDAEISRQAVTLTKVDKIMTVLSTFEESSATCIGNIMAHFKNRRFFEVCLDGHKFIEYVDALFLGLEDIDAQLLSAGGSSVALLTNRKEPRQLAKRIVLFFALLAQPLPVEGVVPWGPVETAKVEEHRVEMINLVTSLANTLKSLIRLALNGALKMERSFNSETCILDFLNLLTNLERTSSTNGSQGGDQSLVEMFSLLTTTSRSDLCIRCSKAVEDSCLKSLDDLFCWHSNPECFSCTTCGRYLGSNPDDIRDAVYDTTSGALYCKMHRTGGCRPAMEGSVIKGVSQLKQFSFLLHCSLGRLYTLLNAQDSRFGLPDQQTDLDEAMRSGPGSDTNVNAYRSADELGPSDDENFIHSPQIAQEFRNLPPLNPLQTVKSIGGRMDRNVPGMSLLAEQSALDRIQIRRLAIAQLEGILGRRLPELEVDGLGADNKTWAWAKFLKAGTGARKTPAANTKAAKVGTFGVPLASLVLQYGVETQLIFDDSTVRIPKFIDLCIQLMRSMDMSVEGVFRKNGNIRRLKETAEIFDQNPALERLEEDNVIQVAALLKKFLRDMPDPLLTHKLYPIFVASQNIDDPNLRKRVLHLCCCLLPRQNLDLLQILLQFMRYVAQWKDTNKMDIPNLATVIAPNILYGNSSAKNPVMDQPYVSIRAVQMLAVYQDEFRLVPQDIRLNSEQ